MSDDVAGEEPGRVIYLDDGKPKPRKGPKVPQQSTVFPERGPTMANAYRDPYCDEEENEQEDALLGARRRRSKEQRPDYTEKGGGFLPVRPPPL